MTRKNICKAPCIPDTTIPCSPDCKNLAKDGHILTKQCMEAGCEEVQRILDLADATEQEILGKYGEKIYFKQ